MEKEQLLLYYNIIEVWKSTWSIGLALGIVSFLVLELASLAGGLAPILFPIGLFSLACSCCLYLIGVIGVLSFFFWKVPMADLSDTGLILYASEMGFRRRLHLSWEEIELASMAKRYVKLFNPQFGRNSRAILDQRVLLLKMMPELTLERLQEVRKLCSSGLNERHFKSDEQGTEIWVTKAPRGGFRLFLSALGKYVTVRELNTF